MTGSDVQVLVLHEDEVLGERFVKWLAREGYSVEAVENVEEALRSIEEIRVDILLCGGRVHGTPFAQILDSVRSADEDITTILIADAGPAKSTAKGTKSAAYDTVEASVKSGQLLPVLARAAERCRLLRENRRFQRELGSRYGPESLLGSSPAIQRVTRLARRVASTATPVLLSGKPGTGKEHMARIIHTNSPRSAGPFIPLDCGVIPKESQEAELFGQEEEGDILRRGIFLEADGGTLFLDEIESISSEVQVKLLKVLDRGRFTPAGSTRSRPIDLRLIAATDANLAKASREGRFLADLYRRLSAVRIVLPPLNKRPGDIPILVRHFLARHAAANNRDLPRISHAAMKALQAYNWPGNVRELERFIERTMVMFEGNLIRPEDLSPFDIPADSGDEGEPVPGDSEQLKEAKKRIRDQAIAEVEKAFLLRALNAHGWNITRAARAVKMQRSNFQAMMGKYNLKRGG